MLNYFWYASGSSFDSIFWIPVYGSGHQDKWWFRFVIKPIYRLACSLNNAKYWFLWRFHPNHRYNIVKTGLKPGYYDADYLMLHACFSLLCRYVEDEMGGQEEMKERIASLKKEADSKTREEPYDGCLAGQAGREDEALALYKWWKFEKPAEEERRNDLMRQLYRGRIKWKPTGNPNLTEMVLPQFKGNEEAMYEEFRALERKIEDDEQAMLHRLIDIRRSLWT